MSEQVAVIIPASLEVAQAFQKIFPNAQIRRIKRKEEQQPEQPNEPVNACATADREKLCRDIVAYCQERNSDVDGIRFFNYYDGRNWIDASGKKITDWKSKVIEWEHNGLTTKPKPSSITGSKVVNFSREQMDKMMEGLDKI